MVSCPLCQVDADEEIRKAREKLNDEMAEKEARACKLDAARDWHRPMVGRARLSYLDQAKLAEEQKLLEDRWLSCS